MTRKIGNRTNSNHSYLRTLATPPNLNLCKKALGSRPWCLKRLLMMPVCESMEECNITWAHPYPSIVYSICQTPFTSSGLPKISSQNSNQRRGRECEGRRPSLLSWVGSHRKHECERTLELRVTPTSPTPPTYRWRCHHRPRSYDLWFVQDYSSIVRPSAKMPQRTKTTTSCATCCQ
jgi:hypothetical protein